MLASELPTPAFLDRHIAKGQEFGAVVANHSRGSELWLGEFASCAGSGVPGVSDSFESCLWFMDALGSLASQGHAVLARQAIIGGDYELVDRDTWAHNPDYWLAYLWPRLMGTRALGVTNPNSNATGLRAYAQCGLLLEGVTLALVNLNAHKTLTVRLSGLSAEPSDQPRQEYHLSGNAEGGGVSGLTSRTLYMRGKPVTEASFAHPLLVPVAEPVTLKPLSIAFVDIPDASARTCLGARARKTDDIAAAQHFSWAGINHYYLWSCNATIRENTLDAVRAAGLRVIRVFLLSTTGQGSVAACSDTPTPDLEPHEVGSYDDTILERLDTLMFEAAARGLKLTVALHDRWSLGCWRTDSYAEKYHIHKVSNCGTEPGLNDPARFYESAEARADFQRRIVHVLSHRSRHTQQPLGQWSEALFSVEAENEAFGHSQVTPAAKGWMCEMGQKIRSLIHPHVLVSSGGGGIGNDTGVAEFRRAAALAQCEHMDVVALHTCESRPPAAFARRLHSDCSSQMRLRRPSSRCWLGMPRLLAAPTRGSSFRSGALKETTKPSRRPSFSRKRPPLPRGLYLACTGGSIPSAAPATRTA